MTLMARHKAHTGTMPQTLFFALCFHLGSIISGGLPDSSGFGVATGAALCVDTVLSVVLSLDGCVEDARRAKSSFDENSGFRVARPIPPTPVATLSRLWLLRLLRMDGAVFCLIFLAYASSGYLVYGGSSSVCPCGPIKSAASSPSGPSRLWYCCPARLLNPIGMLAFTGLSSSTSGTVF